MNKLEPLVTTFLFLIISLFASAQVAVGQWQDQLSYCSGKQVIAIGNDVYLLAESGIMKYNTESGECEKLTKMNALSDVTPTCIAYDETTKYLVIGYSNGNIDLLKNNEITNINDIKQKSINSTKAINSIYIRDKKAYLGCDFGIVVLNLQRLEISETWFIGKNGGYVKINDIDCNNDNIYLATNKGVFQGNFNDALVDFSKWNVLTDIDSTHRFGWMRNQNFNTLKFFQGKLLANYDDKVGTHKDTIMAFDGQQWDTVLTQHDFMLRLTGNADTLFCLSGTSLYAYDANLQLIRNDWWYYSSAGSYDVNAADAFLANNKIWIADRFLGLTYIESWWGIVIQTNSPNSNVVFHSDARKSRLITVSGGYNTAFNPTWRPASITHYQNYEWQTENIRKNAGLENVIDIVSISIDPKDENHFFLSSWVNGLIEFRNNTFYKHYTDENSSLEKIPGTDYIRVGGGAFDKDGNFWVTCSLVSKCLHVLKPNGEWKGFSIPDMTRNIRKMIITEDGTKWLIIGQSGGLLVFNDNGTIDDTSDDHYKKFSIINDEGEVVSNDAFSIAEDKNGTVWVGTVKGIVVYNNAKKIFENNPVKGRQIKVPRNDGTDLADLLLSTDKVTAICIDGADNKWFGTENGGAYYVSEDGTEIYQHFDTNNSGLPSDNILTISIIPESGEVFFGTQKGIVSYRGTATEGSENYDKIYAFPNPVKPDYQGYISIKGLIAGSIVKIVDIAGDLVYEAKATGGQLVWDGKNLNGNRVASGVYIVLVSTEIGEQKASTKILMLK